MNRLFVILICSSLFCNGIAKRTKKLPPAVDRLFNDKLGPEDQFTPEFFTWVGNNLKHLTDVFFDHTSVPDDERTSIFRASISEEFQDTRCNGCTAVINLIKLVIDLGLEYEDVEPIALELCEDVMADQGYRGDIICPGVVPNYGPHLFTIFGETTRDGESICTLLNYCVPEEAWERAENIYYPYFPQPQPEPAGENTGVVQEPLNVEGARDPSEMIAKARVKLEKMGVLEKHEEISHQTSKLKDGHDLRQPRQADDIIRIAFMSDVHVETEYVEGSATDCGLHVCCRGEAEGTGSAASYGDWSCNVPPRTVEMWLQHVATLQPDMVLYTGDTPSNALWAETVDRQHNATRWLASKVAEYMPGVPAYTTIGNHETYPANMYYAPRPEVQELHEDIIETWGTLSGWTQDQMDTFRDAGYYTQLIRPGLRILGWNSNYGFTDNWYNILNEFQPEFERMKTFVEQTLGASRNNSEKVIAVTHHPTGGFRYYAEWETRTLVEYGDVISLHVMGHSHGDGFKVVVDPVTGEARAAQLSGPSANTYSNINPGLRLFYLDANTFELLDYDQYFFYLGNNAGDIVDEPEIALMYTASEEYELDNLTASSFLDLVVRMETNDAIFDRYYANRRMRTTTNDCSGDCKSNTLCSLVTTTPESNLACLLYTVGIGVDGDSSHPGMSFYS